MESLPFILGDFDSELEKIQVIIRIVKQNVQSFIDLSFLHRFFFKIMQNPSTATKILQTLYMNQAGVSSACQCTILKTPRPTPPLLAAAVYSKAVILLLLVHCCCHCVCELLCLVLVL